jgi:hypothetical protein
MLRVRVEGTLTRPLQWRDPPGKPPDPGCSPLSLGESLDPMHLLHENACKYHECTWDACNDMVMMMITKFLNPSITSLHGTVASH